MVIGTEGRTGAQIASRIAAGTNLIDSIRPIASHQDYLLSVFRNYGGRVPVSDLYSQLYRDVATGWAGTAAQHFNTFGRSEIMSGQRQFEPRAFDWGALGINIPGFASGGMHSGGFRVVGENGPELEAVGPSRIYSNSQTRDLLNMTPMLEELRALRDEVARMREEQRGLGMAQATAVRRSQEILRRWEDAGLPEERV
jgi:hypothetical protein